MKHETRICRFACLLTMVIASYSYGAGELQHASVGTELTKIEWESATGHIVDSVTTGDMVYCVNQANANLVRLAVGSAGQHLEISGGFPAWLSTLTVPSTDLSDSVVVSHDNSNGYIKWTDGNLWLMTDEGTNANSIVQAVGKGTGYGSFQAYDEDQSRYLNFYASADAGHITTSAGAIYMQYGAQAGILLFTGSASGETVELSIYGYRAGDSNRPLQMGSGVDAADTASFDGVSNYLFDGAIYSGNNITHATPTHGYIRATGGSGTNITAGSLYLAGGLDTGTGTGGHIIFQLSDESAAAGSGASALATAGFWVPKYHALFFNDTATSPGPIAAGVFPNCNGSGLFASSQNPSGHSELYTIDQDGNITKISPHDGTRWVHESMNIFTGMGIKIDMLNALAGDKDAITTWTFPATNWDEWKPLAVAETVKMRKQDYIANNPMIEVPITEAVGDVPIMQEVEQVTEVEEKYIDVKLAQPTVKTRTVQRAGKVLRATGQTERKIKDGYSFNSQTGKCYRSRTIADVKDTDIVIPVVEKPAFLEVEAEALPLKLP